MKKRSKSRAGGDLREIAAGPEFDASTFPRARLRQVYRDRRQDPADPEREKQDLLSPGRLDVHDAHSRWLLLWWWWRMCGCLFSANVSWWTTAHAAPASR